MNLSFQQMKPVIQRDFDRVLSRYPTDLRHITDRIPEGGDAYARKEFIFKTAAVQCPVRLFPHYPFAFELDVGERRDVCYVGIGNQCREKSGVDFSPLHALRNIMLKHGIGSFNDYTDHIHRTLDHDKLLAVGFKGVYEECFRLNRTETDPEKRRYRDLVMVACRAVEKIGLRLRDLACDLLEDAEESDVRYNLVRIIHSVNTPWEPPETLFDAMNAILCTTLWISGLDGVEMNAYGQLDRLLQPFYERDLQAGIIDEEEAYFLLQCFLYKTDLHCHFNEERCHTYDNGVSVMIGGCDPEGRPVYNPMTDLIIRAYTENKLINPKLNARASADSPREYLEKLAALMRTGNNNLVIENDDYVIPMFLRMGLAPEDARTYVGNGCQEVICRNQIHSRAFAYLSLPQILLHTLTLDPTALPEELVPLYGEGDFGRDSFEAVYRAFLANLRSVCAHMTGAFLPFEKLHPTICPEIMLSAFTADCVANGRDLADGGARYNHKTLSFFGFGTLCDSLLSLRRAYAEGTAEQLIGAMLQNFEGDEPLRLQLQNSRERFGHCPEADEFARALAQELAKVTEGVCNYNGIQWGTSLFTYFNYRTFGENTGATPDGRLAGAPFSRQMNMVSLPELTTAALSMSVLTEAEFQDVAMFDLALPFTVAKDGAGLSALTDYLRTCLQLKIPVLQTNVADVETMQEERQHKGTHPDLVVRVCGYSAVFGCLPENMQDELISRAMS